MRASWLLGLALLGPAAAADEPRGWHGEVTPFIGYQMGGEFDADDDVAGTSADVEIDDAAGYGLIVNFPAEYNTEWEIMLSRQSTSLDTAGLFSPGEPVLDDVDISYIQAGGTYLFNDEWARPYFGATIGVSRFDPDASGFSSETFFAFGVGGGYKLAPTSRIGLRLDARVLGSLVSSDEAVFCRSSETGSGCLIAVSGSVVWQWLVSAGLIVRF